ncbi:hypothetical protein [Luteipulveratus mongoliensis]|uniref:Uncharacterized protein n=1 Tax=Luteipulveratus mongoliensis TaxID=571913 RepID=A0A0K1JNP5_9MICO|nr:hypothetical protein [Luteipulveratus mongoliensis]AKU18344.1 hypothetical protein VV02_25020 [Luteipulveratus mongoliensis]
MTLSRRQLGIAAAAVGASLVTGCSKSPEDKVADGKKWLRRLKGVAALTTAPYEEDSKDERIVLTMSRGLSDKDVRALTREIGKGYDRRFADTEHESSPVELDINGFRGRFHPATTMQTTEDVERALWLRRDGRATSAEYGDYPDVVVKAPDAVVAAVALGFDTATQGGGRERYAVESPSRATRIEWTHSPSLGFRLDRPAVQHLADLQKRYPHTTGWYEGPELKAAIHFSPKDIGLDTLRASLPRLVNGALLSGPEIGWGPARAPYSLFSRAFTGRARTLLDALVTVPGVTELRAEDNSNKVEIDRITVRDRAGYLGAVAAVRKHWGDDYMLIDLVRRPPKYVGQQGEAVFSTHARAKPEGEKVFTAAADAPHVTQVQLAEVRGSLSVEAAIPDAELTAVLRAFAALPPTYEDIVLHESLEPDGGRLRRIGRLSKRKFVAEADPSGRADAALIARVERAWVQASR